jgi:hypothetical protein
VSVFVWGTRKDGSRTAGRSRRPLSACRSRLPLTRTLADALWPGVSGKALDARMSTRLLVERVVRRR